MHLDHALRVLKLLDAEPDDGAVANGGICILVPPLHPHALPRSQRFVLKPISQIRGLDGSVEDTENMDRDVGGGDLYKSAQCFSPLLRVSSGDRNKQGRPDLTWATRPVTTAPGSGAKT